MPTFSELTQFFGFALTLLVLAHGAGYAFHRLGLPRVIGEICGGLLLGPSIAGSLAPGLSVWLFPDTAANAKLLSGLHWLGLLWLMFATGLRVQNSFRTGDRRLVGLLLLGATALPFAAGWSVTFFVDLGGYAGPRATPVTFALVLAISMAVTSIPVISRIFIDLGIMESAFAKIVLTTSTIQDILLLAALSVATSLATGNTTSVAAIALASGQTLLFGTVVLVAGPRLLRLLASTSLHRARHTLRTLYALFWCCLVVSLATFQQVNWAFGALLAGVAFGKLPHCEFAEAKQRITSLGLRFFVPAYFALVGFHIDLPTAFDPPSFLGFLLFSSAIVGASVFIPMRLCRCSPLTSWHFAVAMNTRGGPGIVLASIALDFGLIDQRFYVTLVLVAILTSLAAGVWFRHAVAAGLPLLRVGTAPNPAIKPAMSA